MSDSSLGALQELKDAISQESCIPKPPFNVQKINTIKLMAPDARPDAYNKYLGTVVLHLKTYFVTVIRQPLMLN